MRRKVKKKIVLLAITAILIGLVAGFYYIKNYYIKEFLRENLGVEFSKVYAVPLTKTIVIKDLSYRDTNNKKGETVKIETLKVTLDSVQVRDKILNLREISVDNLKIIDHKGVNIISPNGASNGLVTGKNSQDGIKKEENENRSIKQDVIDYIKDGGVTEKKALTERVIEIVRLLIDENMVQRQFDKIASDIVKKEIAPYSNEGKKALEIINNRIKDERKNSDFWTINVEKAELKTEIFGTNLRGTVGNLTNRLSSSEKPVILNITDDKKTLNLGGEVILETMTGNLKIDINKFDYSNITGIRNFVNRGDIKIIENSNLNKGNFVLNGIVNLTSLELNTSNIVREIINTQNLRNTDVRVRIIEFVLSKVDSLEVEYTYNSQKNELNLRTNIVKEMNRIISENPGEIEGIIKSAAPFDLNRIIGDKVGKASETIKKVFNLGNSKDSENETPNKINKEIEKGLDKVDGLLKKIF